MPKRLGALLLAGAPHHLLFRDGLDVFGPDGTRIAATSANGTFKVYVLPIDELLPIARSRLLRGFTEQECRRYLHIETCTAS